MKRGELLDAASAHAIGFEWLRAAVAPESVYGEDAFAEQRPFMPGQERVAQERAERVARIADAFDLARFDRAREAMRNVPDARSAIARASMDDVLDDAHLLELQRCFDAAHRLDSLIDGCPDLPNIAGDAVRACARALEPGRTGEGFYLSDGFDSELGAARAEHARAQAMYEAARGRAVAAVAHALGREISLPEFIVMRADLAGPLPPGVRVVREAPTYLLCELDPDERVLDALGARDAAAIGVAQREEVVRTQLAATIGAHASALDAAVQAFGEIDVLVAAARFAHTQRCTVATVGDGEFAVTGARFSPLEAELAAQARAFAPVDLRLEGVAVLTGPNMGGKSVALRTSGFIAMCAAYGLPVPAQAARVPLFSEIAWLGIGADQDDEPGGLLSSFAREVIRLRDMLAHRSAKRLVLLDEFARTTTPYEGKALLIAVIERLQNERACGLAATHLGGVAAAAHVRHYAVRGLRGIPQRPATTDLSVALETLAASMDYTLEEVTGERPREADAIALASLLGIDDGVIAAAHRALELE